MKKFTARLKKNRYLRIILGVCAAAVMCAGAFYLYHHNPVRYPVPCVLHELTGLYCPGCGAGRASYAILHGNFAEAFCYNPLMTLVLPLIALYIIVRTLDWIITGGNHIDSRISIKMLTWLLAVVLIYGVIRNIPVFPFTLLAPGGMAQIIQ